MGSKQTKLENTQISSADVDPRSPNNLRTPIVLPRPVDSLALSNERGSSENPLDILRKRFFKGFTYNQHDPRSPNLNRTPLCFEDSSDRTLNLNDTFADLFVESNIPDPELCADDSEMQEQESIKMEPLQQQFDPRSPSIGVERTPIIFNDDENKEDAYLENILSTLSLNLNASGSSVASLRAADTPNNKGVHKPMNKHLDRVRAVKKPSAKGPHRKQKRPIRQKIYEDNENSPITLQFKTTIDLESPKRTPLSCVRNRAQIRSRSVESSVKKTRLSLMSFDDTLNHNENRKMLDLRPQNGIQA